MTAPSVFLKVAPQFAAAWVDPHTIRFGFSHATLELSALCSGDRALLSMLLTGTTLKALQRTAVRHRITPEQLTELLRLINPVLQAAASPSPANNSLNLFQPSGYQIVDAADPQAVNSASTQLVTAELNSHGHYLQPGAVLLTINRFLLDCRFALAAQQRSPQPQLPLIFSDSTVRIGPLLTPAGSPCPACCEQEQLLADPDKAVMLPQLLEHTPATANRSVIKQLAPLLAFLIAAPAAAHSTQFVYDFSRAQAPLPQAVQVQADSDCLCTQLEVSPYENTTAIATV